MIKNYSFKLLSKYELGEILLIRNQEEVRNASFNTKKISEIEHLKWFESKIKKEFFHHYVLKHDNKIIGLGYGENYSKKEKSCLWGFYLDLTIKSEIKYGSLIKYLLIEQLFSIPNIDQIKCQVKKDFKWIKDWHVNGWGHEVVNFDEKLNCYNLLLKKESWNSINFQIFDKGFKKN